jgi:hypothetical protein
MGHDVDKQEDRFEKLNAAIKNMTEEEISFADTFPEKLLVAYAFNELDVIEKKKVDEDIKDNYIIFDAINAVRELARKHNLVNSEEYDSFEKTQYILKK